MRAIIQRVTEATLFVENVEKCNIALGLVVLLGIEHDDDIEDVKWLANKISNLRIFSDIYNDSEENNKELSIKDITGDLMLVSQFTLHARTKKGNRPSYIDAAPPEISRPLYEEFIKKIKIDLGKEIKTGNFGSHMQISMTNDGPVTIFIDTKCKK